MPREQSRAALKRAASLTAAIAAIWLIGAALAQSPEPSIRNVERQLDRHVASTGHEVAEKRVARLEVAVAANTEQLTMIRGGGALLGIILIGLNVLNLVGWKVNLVRTKGGH